MRCCVVCGRSLIGRRSDCLTCSTGCRREAARLRAVLSGRSDGPYQTVADLLLRRQKRAKPSQRLLSAPAVRTIRLDE